MKYMYEELEDRIDLLEADINDLVRHGGALYNARNRVERLEEGINRGSEFFIEQDLAGEKAWLAELEAEHDELLAELEAAQKELENLEEEDE